LKKNEKNGDITDPNPKTLKLEIEKYIKKTKQKIYKQR
jgi:hypothetical protein